MGYAMVMGRCLVCGQTFTFHPHKAPSVRVKKIDGTNPREPICRECHAMVNAKRVEKGLDPFPDPLPGAYEPCEESEL